MTNNIKTKEYYDQIPISNIEDRNFIYFPALYVPEPNSVIMLKTFENQLLILDMLNKAIPNDWKIYYKSILKHSYLDNYLPLLDKQNILRN